MFTRGETQAIAVVTLGGDTDAQRIDGLADTDKFRRFYLNYFFPPSCVGEARVCQCCEILASTDALMRLLGRSHDGAVAPGAGPR